MIKANSAMVVAVVVRKNYSMVVTSFSKKIMVEFYNAKCMEGCVSRQQLGAQHVAKISCVKTLLSEGILPSRITSASNDVRNTIFRPVKLTCIKQPYRELQVEVLQFPDTGGKKSSRLRMLEALAMAVWSATICYFRLSLLCVPFVGFQVSTEITSADSTLSTILVDVFGYDSATIYFAISVAAVRCD